MLRFCLLHTLFPLCDLHMNQKPQASYVFFFFNYYYFLIVVDLSYIEMKQPWVYMCSPSPSPLPPPSPPAPSRSSQCTRSERKARILNYWDSGEVPGFSSLMELCLHCLTHAINSEHRWLPHTALSYSKNLQFILKILKQMGPTWMCPSAS